MIKFRKTATRTAVPFWSPASLLATWFGLGLIPVASGTWGSLGAFPLLWLIAYIVPHLPVPAGLAATSYGPLIFFLLVMSIVILLISAIGVWAANTYVKQSETEDPGAIVIDEVAGQLVTLMGVLPVPLLLPHVPWVLPITLLAAFALFRLCDIVKPWPVNWCDTQVKGGLGVMLDDIVAGFIAIPLYYAGLFLYQDIFKVTLS